MSLGVATVLIGGAIGLALAVFGARMLVTGRAPSPTTRVFREVRDAAMYHLLFGLALIVLAVGTSVPGGGVPAIASAVIAVSLVGVAVIKHRPRGRKTADHE
jgi:hypothetical protein